MLIFAKIAQSASKGLASVKAGVPLSKAAAVLKNPTAKKVAIGTAVIGGGAVVVSSSGATIPGGPKPPGASGLFGLDTFISSPKAAVGKLTGLAGQLAEGVVFIAAGVFVVGSTLLAHNMVGNGWLTATVGTTSTFVAVGIGNRED